MRSKPYEQLVQKFNDITHRSGGIVGLQFGTELLNEIRMRDELIQKMGRYAVGESLDITGKVVRAKLEGIEAVMQFLTSQLGDLQTELLVVKALVNGKVEEEQ